jgi:hypothetical protein
MINAHLLSPMGHLDPSIYANQKKGMASSSTDGESVDDEREYFKALEFEAGYESAESDDDDDELEEDCGPSFNHVTGKFRTSDEDLRYAAMTTPICELANFKCPSGNRSRCAFGGCCFGNFSVPEIWEIRKAFWKFGNAAAPTSGERNHAITEMLKLFLDPKTLKFNYMLEKSNRGRVEVCERSFMMILGYKSITSQWDRCKTKVRSLVRQNIISHQPQSSLARPRTNAKCKFECAKAWIRMYAQGRTNQLIHMAHLRQRGDFVDTDQPTVNIRSVPFDNEKAFWDYYVAEASRTRDPVAGKKCFVRALRAFAESSLSTDNFVVRMQRCKNNFSTCDICNNAQALLKDRSRRWTTGQVKILDDYLKVHLKIQSAEREAQRLAICRAREKDVLGQPKEAFMLFDGFSIFKGVTPKWGKGTYGGKSHTEKEEPKMENRVIAGIVICGDIDGVFVYTVDQLTSGGANLMIEVIRRALSDLGDILKEIKQLVPKILFLQFDNCGENKNKFMMAYCSMLVESGR